MGWFLRSFLPNMTHIFHSITVELAFSSDASGQSISPSQRHLLVTQ